MFRGSASVPALLALLALASCGGSGESEDLEESVNSFSSAFLSGDEYAYDMLSERCQGKVTREDFKKLAKSASETYGDLDIESLDTEVDGDSATATYTFEESDLNQTDEPWVKEDGNWLNDGC